MVPTGRGMQCRPIQVVSNRTWQKRKAVNQAGFGYPHRFYLRKLRDDIGEGGDDTRSATLTESEKNPRHVLKELLLTAGEYSAKS